MGSLVPPSHSKVVATAHPGYSHSGCTLYTMIEYTSHGWEGGTVGDYIRRSLERGAVLSRDSHVGDSGRYVRNGTGG